MTTTELRNELGLSRAEFSRLTGIPLGTLADWEQERRTMSSWLMPMIELYARQQYAGKYKRINKEKGDE